jgi:hypothetical protein
VREFAGEHWDRRFPAVVIQVFAGCCLSKVRAAGNLASAGHAKTAPSLLSESCLVPLRFRNEFNLDLPAPVESREEKQPSGFGVSHGGESYFSLIIKGSAEMHDPLV